MLLNASSGQCAKRLYAQQVLRHFMLNKLKNMHVDKAQLVRGRPVPRVLYLQA